MTIQVGMPPSYSDLVASAQDPDSFLALRPAARGHLVGFMEKALTKELAKQDPVHAETCCPNCGGDIRSGSTVCLYCKVEILAKFSPGSAPPVPPGPENRRLRF